MLLGSWRIGGAPARLAATAGGTEMANLDIIINHTAEPPAGPDLLRELAADVREAAGEREALIAAVAGLCRGFALPAAIVYTAEAGGWRVAEPRRDVHLSQPRKLAALRRWATKDGKLPMAPASGRAPAAAAPLGLTVTAEATLSLEEAPAFLLQFFAQSEARLDPDFAPTAQLLAELLELRLARDRAQAARRAGERRFRDLAESATGHYWEMDEKLRFSQLAGVEDYSILPMAGEIIGRTRWDVAGGDPERDPKWRRHRDDLQAHRPVISFEYANQMGNDEPRHWRVNGRPVFDAEGRFRGYRGVSIDITARKQAEARLLESEDRFHRFAELTSDWLWEMDENLRYVWVSDIVQERLGNPPEWHYGKTREEIGNPEDNPEAWRRHLETLQRHEPYRDFIMHLDTPRGPRWIRSNGVPLFDEAGNFKGYVGTGVDLTEVVEADRAASRARALLENAVESLREMFVLWDEEDRLLLCNEQFREINAPVAQFIQPGTHFADHIRALIDADLCPDFRGREEEWYQERLARHASPEKPFEIQRQDGRWVLISEHRLPQGGTVTLSTDISELKRAESELRAARDELEQRVADRTSALEAANRALREEIAERARVTQALRESEERLRDFAEASADGFWQMDAQLRFTYASPNIDRLLGVEPDWHYGKTPEDLFGHEPADETWERHLRTLERHEPFRDFVYYRNGGHEGIEPKWLSVSGRPLHDRDGQFFGYRGTIRDVTAAMESERAIRENEAQLRLIADNLPVLIAYIDRDQHMRFANRVAEQLLGRRADELVGRHISEIYGPEAYRRLEPRIKSVLGGETVRYEHVLTYPDGITRTAQVILVPDFDKTTALRGYIVLVLDVTEQRASEEQLRQAQKMEAVGQLTGGIAHDFNNLLTVIQGNLELILLDLTPDHAAKRHAEAGLHAVKHGALLTQHLLAFARKQSLMPQPTDLNTLVAGFAPILQRTLGEEIEIRIALAEALWAATVDRGQLENVMLNLALNARDAMPGGGTLTIETGSEWITEETAAELDEVEAGAYVTLTIRDDGHGMSAEVLSHAVEPFFTTKEVGKGSGLGLSMVFGFVKQSRGHLTIDSAPGAGTLVRLYLPRADAALPAGEALEAAPPVRGSGSILVVEDDARVRNYAADHLARLGYRVVAVAGGERALAAIEAGDVFDLLFTDVVLAGGLSGPELAQKARRRQPTLKVLFTSGHSEDTVLARGQLDPTSEFLPKPYSGAKLAWLIHEVLSERTD